MPRLERLAEEIHQKWIDTKLSQGISSRLAEDGEELMVPYSQLSEKAKQLDRNSVSAVLDALDTLGYIVTIKYY